MAFPQPRARSRLGRSRTGPAASLSWPAGRRAVAAGLVALLAAAGLAAATPAVGSPAETSPASDPAPPAPSAGNTAAVPPATEITLVTGHTVRFSGSSAAGYNLDLGSAEDEVTTMNDATGVYVIPTEAEPLLDAGVLDRDLFNVELLAEYGYTDDRTDELPVIVAYRQPVGRAAGTQDAAQLSDRAGGLPATSRVTGLKSINGAGVAVDKQGAEQFWQYLSTSAAVAKSGSGPAALAGGIAKVWLDGKSEVHLDDSAAQVGAPEAWDAGYDGSGATVAVLDTGYDPDHPDLAGRVVDAEGFLDDSTVDGHGHGTHVATTIAGTGAASDGQYTGVAPGADLLVGKVCTDGGSCTNSAVIAGMQWAAEQGADVANLSLGGGPTDGSDPLSQAVDQLTADYGTLFVISAGNSGPGASTAGAPGVAGSALTIGAVDKQDQLAGFSSRGPVLYSAAMKPDISAPGVGIVAGRASGSDMGTPVGDDYTAANGTSMAAPHAAGAAAVLAQKEPGWDAQALKAALISTSDELDYSPYEAGAGRLDIGRAAQQDVVSTTGHVDFGLREWPHEGSTESRTVSYRNDTTEDVTLTLDLTVTGEDGSPAPEGGFALDADEVTVPAGGAAEVTVTLDESAADDTGVFGGALTASGDGGVEVRNAVGAVFGAEQHRMRFELVTPDEESCQGQQMLILNLETGVYAPQQLTGADCSATVPVDADDPYSAFTAADWTDEDGTEVQARGAVPEFVADESGTITLDLTEAQPVTVDVPRAVDITHRWPAMVRLTADKELFASFGYPIEPDAQLRVLPTDTVDEDVFGFVDQVILAEAGAEVPSYVYHLRDWQLGGIPDDLGGTYTEDDFTAVTARNHAEESKEGYSYPSARPANMAMTFGGATASQSIPTEQTEYYGPVDDDLVWTDQYEHVYSFADYDGDLPVWAIDAPSWSQGDDTVTRGVPGIIPRPLPEPQQPGDNVQNYFSRSENICHACVDDDGLTVSLPPTLQGDLVPQLWLGYLGSGGNLTGDLVPAEELSLRADGEEVSREQVVGPGYAPAHGDSFGGDQFALPDGAERLELTQQLSTETSEYGASSETTWEFDAVAPDGSEHEYRCLVGEQCQPQSLTFLEYDLSGLSLDNTAPVGQELAFEVTPVHQFGTEVEITDLSTEVSFDTGDTWTEARTVPNGDGSYQVAVDHPLASAGGAVSVRVTAEDAQGGTVEQTQPDLYGVAGCSDPDPRETVVLGQVDSGVPNRTVGGDCTINDVIDDGVEWPNHGAFMRHIQEVTDELRATNVIDPRERAAIIRSAARSDVGKGPRMLS